MAFSRHPSQSFRAEIMDNLMNNPTNKSNPDFVIFNSFLLHPMMMDFEDTKAETILEQLKKVAKDIALPFFSKISRKWCQSNVHSSRKSNTWSRF